PVLRAADELRDGEAVRGPVAAIEDAARVDGRAVVLRGGDGRVPGLEEEDMVAALREADLVAVDEHPFGGRLDEFAMLRLDARGERGRHCILNALALWRRREEDVLGQLHVLVATGDVERSD